MILPENQDPLGADHEVDPEYRIDINDDVAEPIVEKPCFTLPVIAMLIISLIVVSSIGFGCCFGFKETPIEVEDTPVPVEVEREIQSVEAPKKTGLSALTKKKILGGAALLAGVGAIYAGHQLLRPKKPANVLEQYKQNLIEGDATTVLGTVGTIGTVAAAAVLGPDLWSKAKALLSKDKKVKKPDHSRYTPNQEPKNRKRNKRAFRDQLAKPKKPLKDFLTRQDPEATREFEERSPKRELSGEPLPKNLTPEQREGKGAAEKANQKLRQDREKFDSPLPQGKTPAEMKAEMKRRMDRLNKLRRQGSNSTVTSDGTVNTT